MMMMIKMMRFEIILDKGERLNKCTVAPLSGRKDFKMIRTNGTDLFGPLEADILLHHLGTPWSLFNSHSENTQIPFGVNCIATIDCVWRRLDRIFHRIHGRRPTLVQLPLGIKTAYPRRSRLNTDPASGLATIEALFTASALLGRLDLSLFSHYHFGKTFLQINLEKFQEYGLTITPELLQTLPKPITLRGQ